MLNDKYPITLGAGASDVINVSEGASSFLLVSSTGDLEMKFDDSGYATFAEGEGFADRPFKKVSIRNTGANAVSFVVRVSDGRIVDNNVNVGGDFVTVKGDNFDFGKVVHASAGAIKLCDAESDRTSISICPLVDVVYVGKDASVDASTGWPIFKEEKQVLDITSEMWIYSPVVNDTRYFKERR